MISEDDLDFETNDDGEMVDDKGDTVYCDNPFCEAPATKRVAVSEDELHDDTRNYCSACEDVYTVGVQHGRYHEAALHGDRPGHDSAQDPPPQVLK